MGESFVLRGIAVSPGIVIGRAVLLDRRRLKMPRYRVGVDRVAGEVQRFERARTAADEELTRIQSRLEAEGSEPHIILQAHQLMLRDEMLIDQVVSRIKTEHLCAEWAIGEAVSAIKSRF